jgi:MATE family multidrug resistance protein
MVVVNRDIFLRSVFIDAAFFLFTALSARMGDVVLAANAVLLHFWTFLAYAVDGFAHAAEALVGSAVGARHRQHLRGAVRATSLWALVFSGAFTLLYAVFGTLLIDVITSVPEVRDAARAYLPWIVVSPLIAVWGFQLDGIFIGATWTAEMRDAMLISLAVYVAALVVFLPPLGNHGLWLAFTVFTAARGVTLAVRYPRLERTVDKAA